MFKFNYSGFLNLQNYKYTNMEIKILNSREKMWWRQIKINNLKKFPKQSEVKYNIFNNHIKI